MVIVTILLLPLRVALIAALAIPVTLCGTLGVMNALGIALHQVSIAALIMVLGIVVDDAIVIADNYVELLDHKVPKAEAAWRCASDVFVPVLTATITIIASFLPLLIITGSVRRIHHGASHHGGDRLGGFLHRGGHADPSPLQILHQEGAARPRRRGGPRQGEEEPAGPAPGYIRGLDQHLHEQKVAGLHPRGVLRSPSGSCSSHSCRSSSSPRPSATSS